MIKYVYNPFTNNFDAVDTGGSGSIILETNGVPNGDQTRLNLIEGTNITITDDGMGNITFDVTGGGSSPLTTKGDIFGYSTMDARIPVGNDGQVLQADSAQALGVKYVSLTGAAFVDTVAYSYFGGF